MAMRQHGILNKFNLLGAAASIALLAGCASLQAEEAPAELAEATADAAPQTPPYLDASLSPEARAKDLVSRMTLEEKAAQMYDKAAGIPRLGLHEYNWWNEALHGVARAGHATVFPQAIGLASTWDEDLMLELQQALKEILDRHPELLDVEFSAYSAEVAALEAGTPRPSDPRP